MILRHLKIPSKLQTELVDNAINGDIESYGRLCREYYTPMVSIAYALLGDHHLAEDAVQEAFLYDSKIIIEECIEGREIECSVLGNENPVASVPGEIKPRHEFYSYDAKYVDYKGAELEIPAQIPGKQREKVRALAVKSFKVLCCEGMARVDMFLRADGELLVNEINTIPGFTQISMYPKLWEASGISQTKLIDRLIKLALDRYKKESTLKRSFS